MNPTYPYQEELEPHSQLLWLQMKSKETIIGIIVTLSVFGIIAVVTGIYGIFYLGIALIFAILSISLFSRKSVISKAGAVALNTDIIYKILMPKKYKKAIKQLEENELNKETD